MSTVARELTLADFVADDTADNCARGRSNRAAAGEDRAADRARTGAYGRIALGVGHAGATAEAERERRGEDAYCNTFRGFHFHFLMMVLVDVSSGVGS